MKLARTIAAMAAVVIATAGLTIAATPAKLTIPMKALNGSGENGTATLTQVAGGVSVKVSLVNGPTDAQPTHIHIGTCGKINAAPEYPLLSTIAGSSVTTVKGVTLKQLLAGHYAINVHKSTSELAVYVSCGNIAEAP